MYKAKSILPAPPPQSHSLLIVQKEYSGKNPMPTPGCTCGWISSYGWVLLDSDRAEVRFKQHMQDMQDV